MPRGMALSDNTAKVLIRAVKKRGCLWDPEDDRYNDRYHMARSWSEIAALIGLPEDVVRVKWKNMRDLFKKEIRKYGTNIDDYTGQWRHFDSLTFLYKTCATTTTEISEETSGEDKGPTMKQEYIDLGDENGDADSNDAEVYLRDNYEDPLPEKQMKVSTDDDYDVMFLKSLSPYFKQLDPIRKLVVRSKMQDMLLNEIAAQASTTPFQLKKCSDSGTKLN